MKTVIFKLIIWKNQDKNINLSIFMKIRNEDYFSYTKVGDKVKIQRQFSCQKIQKPH